MAFPRPSSAHSEQGARPDGATGVIVFADGRTVWGRGFGAEGSAVGELCFNTAMTGYQEVMTDPSYARQVVAFTFPHIGNVGANEEDVEAGAAHALGCLVREAVTSPVQFPLDAGFSELDGGDRADRGVGGRYARADAAGAARGAADGGVRAFGQGRVRSRRACRSRRRSGRGSRAWTWRKRLAASSWRRGRRQVAAWAGV